MKQADGSDIIYELERRGHPYRAGDRVCIFPKRMGEAKLAERLFNLKVGRVANYSVGPHTVWVLYDVKDGVWGQGFNLRQYDVRHVVSMRKHVVIPRGLAHKRRA